MSYVGFDSRSEWLGGELAALVAAGVLPRGRALDVGCGHGTEALALAVHGWDVLGIDVDARALAEAAARRAELPARARRRVRFRRADALAFRAEAGAYAVVLDRLVYQNLFPGSETPRPRIGFPAARRRLLELAARALRPGGVLVLRFLPAELGPGARLDPRDGVLTPRDAAYLAARFEALGPEVGFVGLAADPTMLSDGALIARPLELSLRVFRRRGD
jgi:SAM-dependent methyltransferase